MATASAPVGGGGNEMSELRSPESRNNTSHTNVNETNTTEDKMRGSSVKPSQRDDGDNLGKENDLDDPTDASDGYDPLSSESLGPLLTSNQYSMRKIAAQALMDVALMMANISQLRTLLNGGEAMEYYVLLVSMVVVSLAFQLLFALLIFFIWMKESDQHLREDYTKTLREVIEVSKNGTAAEKLKTRNTLLEKKETFDENRLTSHLNYATMILVFIITVINMFITGFGIKLEAAAVVDNNNAAAKPTQA
jgi:hypothetical protein